MIDEGEGTLWECWNQHSITEGTSCYSQGWGTAVAYQILQYVLGAQFVEPGGTRIEWRPRRVDVNEITARIRTKHGDVTLGWKGEDLIWEIPENVMVRIFSCEEAGYKDVEGIARQEATNRPCQLKVAKQIY